VELGKFIESLNDLLILARERNLPVYDVVAELLLNACGIIQACRKNESDKDNKDLMLQILNCAWEGARVIREKEDYKHRGIE